MKKFYTGWNQINNGVSGPSTFSHTMVSVNRILKRRSSFQINNWILDSGAFTRLNNYGNHLSIKKYIEIINRFSGNGILDAVVTQDYLPKPDILKKLNINVKQCQDLTIKRYKNSRDKLT